ATVTFRARSGIGSLGMARPATVGTGFGTSHRKLLLGTLGCLFEFDGDRGAEVLALLGTASAAATTATAAEELLEDVAHPAAHIAATHAAEGVATHAARSAHPAHPASTAPTAAIEPAAFFGLFEAVVAH